MAMLLRKVWGSVLARAAPGPVVPAAPGSPRGRRGAHPGAEQYSASLSLGALDAVPTDVLAQILRLLGPVDAARSGTVCRAWRILASDNGLWAFFLRLGPEPWDLVVFAETNLAAGPDSHPWSVPPLTVSPSPLVTPWWIWVLQVWLEQVCCSFWALCDILDTESARASRKQYKETLYSVLFDMNVPAVCAVDQAVLSLYASKRTSGIVVHIGFNTTSVVPIFEGRVMYEIGVETVGQGALKLTGFLKELMHQRDISCESLIKMISDICLYLSFSSYLKKLCYVAADYEAELRKDTQASCEVDAEGSFTLSEERFKTTEILFQPHMGGMRAMGLHKAVSLCMDHCYNSEVIGDDSWYKTVVLAGGSSCLPGLPERLEKELHQLLPPYISEGIRVLPPPFGSDSAWFGAKMISNVSTFTEAWCVKKKHFRQKIRRNGPLLVNSW
ncbi:Actin-related protein 8 [Dichanthelium oligosanthes]|uniref:Actin-related protein 8 n=1 Tax=Dichanthelium oligosanthes TaxID=888268 RepID=A0A1E5WA45_9POAL|nr:Actin-related protein 8 [Dichanthelium oligosanthes]